MTFLFIVLDIMQKKVEKKGLEKSFSFKLKCEYISASLVHSFGPQNLLTPQLEIQHTRKQYDISSNCVIHIKANCKDVVIEQFMMIFRELVRYMYFPFTMKYLHHFYFETQKQNMLTTVLQRRYHYSNIKESLQSFVPLSDLYFRNSTFAFAQNNEQKMLCTQQQKITCV